MPVVIYNCETPFSLIEIYKNLNVINIPYDIIMRKKEKSALFGRKTILIIC